MQRILQPGGIKRQSPGSTRRIRLPGPATLFAIRAGRLSQLANGRVMADYLRLAARLARAQHAISAGLPAPRMAPAHATDPAPQAPRPRLFPAAEHTPAEWHEVLAQLLDALEQGEGREQGHMPDATKSVIERLRNSSKEALNALARPYGRVGANPLRALSGGQD